MNMTGEQRVKAPRERVWEALNDPEVLKRCLPGCQSLEREGEQRFNAVMGVKVGPIGARFSGAIDLSDIDPLNGYTLRGQWQGGAAGFAKGEARVRLDGTDGSTVISYDLDVQVGGRLAQLGGAAIDATARKLAAAFFRNFEEVLAAEAPASGSPVPQTAESADSAAKASAAAVRVDALPDGAARLAAMQTPRHERLPVPWLLAVALAALTGFLLGRMQTDSGSDWMGLAVGFLLLVVAAAAFEFGRRAAAPVLVLDPAMLARLVARSPGEER